MPFKRVNEFIKLNFDDKLQPKDVVKMRAAIELGRQACKINKDGKIDFDQSVQILTPYYRTVMGNTLNYVKEIFEAADVCPKIVKMVDGQLKLHRIF